MMGKCIKCGECCKRLYWSDRLRISWATKTVMLRKQCSFLFKTGLCLVHGEKPKVCRDWVCGAYYQTKNNG